MAGSNNPFDPYREQMQAMEDLRPTYTEEFYRSIGRPQDLPDRENLGPWRRFFNAVVASQTGGFEPFQPGEPPGRIDPYKDLTKDEQEKFFGQPKVKQVMEMSRYPGGIALLAQNKQLYDHLFSDEPTVFQQLVDTLDHVQSPEHRAALTNQLFDLGVSNGLILPETADYARRAWEASQISDPDMKSILMVTMGKTTSQEEFDQKNIALKSFVQNIEEKHKKAAADLQSTYAGTAHTQELTRKSVEGPLMIFPGENAAEMRTSDPRFKERLAAGDIAFEVPALSQTEAAGQAAASAITKSGRNEAVGLYATAAENKIRLEGLMKAFNDPNLSLTGLMGIVREYGPATGNIPILRDFVAGTTGKTPGELQQIKTEMSLLQFGLVEPIIQEKKKTDEERRAAGKITSPGTLDSQEQINGRNRSLYHFLLLRADKNLYTAEGKFFYDITNPDRAIADRAKAELKRDLKRRAYMSDAQVVETFNSIIRNQELMRRIGPAEVKRLYVEPPAAPTVPSPQGP